MDVIHDTCDHVADIVVHGGLTRLITKLSRSLFGERAVVIGPSPRNPHVAVTPVAPLDDDLGWLSLTRDADGRGVHEDDVLCLGVIPDDLDLHDPDGGDLSWIGLNPVERVQPIS